MRFLMSSVAATALLATPALAQAPEGEAPDVAEAGAAAEGELGQVTQELSTAGFRDAREMQGTEVYRTSHHGEQALVIVLGSGLAGDDLHPGPDLTEDPTAAVPEDPHGERLPTASAIPDSPETDAIPDDPAAEAAEVPEDLPEPPLGDATVEADAETETAAGEPTLIRDALSSAGFADAELTADVSVLHTIAGDGRTMLIVLGAGLNQAGAGEDGEAPPRE